MFASQSKSFIAELGKPAALAQNIDFRRDRRQTEQLRILEIRQLVQVEIARCKVLLPVMGFLAVGQWRSPTAGSRLTARGGFQFGQQLRER